MKTDKKRAIIFSTTALLITFLLIAPMFQSKKRSKGNRKLFIEDDLLMLTYNIGDCTFGESILKIKPNVVSENLKGIISILEEKDYDIVLLQESNWINFDNYFINASKKIANNFYDNSFAYGSNSNILNYCDNGNMTLTNYDSTSNCLKIPVNGEGLINDKFYVHKLLIETRIKIHNSLNELVVYNIHLAPYSKNKETRSEQIKYIFNLAKTQYDLGNYVVIGGDWNINLLNESLLKKELEILGDNPWSFDVPITSTHQGFNTKKSNKVRVIDGYLFSPNIEGSSINLDTFEYSDHSPVELKLKLKK